MPSWVAKPTVETVLLISGAVGGFWCLFVCICQIVRRAAKTARKNTASYRGDPSRHSSEYRGNLQQSDHALRHGGTPMQEAQRPLRPLFMPTQGPAPNSMSHTHRSLSSVRNVPRGTRTDSRDGHNSRVTSHARGVIYPDYVERVLLPECADGGNCSDIEDPRFAPSSDMNEEPPPYDEVDDYADYAPPAYSDIFPNKP